MGGGGVRRDTRAEERLSVLGAERRPTWRAGDGIAEDRCGEAAGETGTRELSGEDGEPALGWSSGERQTRGELAVLGDAQLVGEAEWRIGDEG